VRFDNLQDWLRWQETLHPRNIDLGLERVAAIWSRMCPEPVPFPLITIAGTNGKGSCATMLESIYLAGGYRTACYTSPHLLRYNERVRLDGIELDDADLCAAFARVDAARGDSTLTYFELGTLAALDLFVRAEPDLAILEVGLGGRLDAVNILDPDVAVVTTIDFDHTAWLGETLDEIAAEKAGIFRSRRPAVVGHRSPSRALIERADALGCDLFVLGRDFDSVVQGAHWRWAGPEFAWAELPAPAMRGAFQRDNAATALMAVSCLEPRLPVVVEELRLGLRRARANGRFQVIPGEATLILDVAHNAQAARALAANLQSFNCPGRVHAVLATLKDKDPRAIAGPLAGLVDHWYLGQARDSRALPVAELRAALKGVALDSDLSAHCGIDEALVAATAHARPGDCILALGSFTTVEAALLRTDRKALA
jgi:dihydrofolate synthase/folylpolyglutamate synthase